VPLLSQGNFRQVVAITSKSESAIGQILNYGLARIPVGPFRRDDIEKAMEESLMEVVPRLEKRTHYLATFANLATLLGLARHRHRSDSRVGAVAHVNRQKANLLSASISVAMNCTAFGLMTAVPIPFLHAVLQTKTTELIDSLEMASVKSWNAITERQRRRCAAASLTQHATEARPSRASAEARLPEAFSHATFFATKKIARKMRKAGRAAARADDRHLHGAWSRSAYDRGLSKTVVLTAEPAGPPSRSSASRLRARDRSDGAQGPASGRRPQYRPVRYGSPQADGYDYEGLTDYLKRVKGEIPRETDATILLESDTPYDILVQVMDRVRDVRQGTGAAGDAGRAVPDISIGMRRRQRGDAPAPAAASRRREVERSTHEHRTNRARRMAQHHARHKADAELNLIPLIDILS